jgi:hypothetical protein
MEEYDTHEQRPESKGHFREIRLFEPSTNVYEDTSLLAWDGADPI